MRLAEPYWLLCLVFAVVPLFAPRARPSLVYSSIALFAEVGVRSWRQRWLWLPTALRVAWLGLLGVAAARPQTLSFAPQSTREPHGCLAVCLDVSGSMGAIPRADGGPKISRLNRAKKKLLDWLPNAADPPYELAVTTFSVEPLVVCPPTADAGFARQAISNAALDRVDGRTDLGAALAVSVDLAKFYPWRSSAILLVTDGAQRIPDALGPLGGARIAEAFGVPIFILDAAGSEADPADRRTLAQVAELSGGKLLNDVSEMASAWKPDPPTARSSPQLRWVDRFPWVIGLALGVWCLEALLRRTWLRVTPEPATFGYGTTTSS